MDSIQGGLDSLGVKTRPITWGKQRSPCLINANLDSSDFQYSTRASYPNTWSVYCISMQKQFATQSQLKDLKQELQIALLKLQSKGELVATR